MLAECDPSSAAASLPFGSPNSEHSPDSVMFHWTLSLVSFLPFYQHVTVKLATLSII